MKEFFHFFVFDESLIDFLFWMQYFSYICLSKPNFTIFYTFFVKDISLGGLVDF
jgi:hypothetical protein